MVVGGPNARTDFHINQTNEFFYQLEGSAFLRIINEEGKIDKVELTEGDILSIYKDELDINLKSENGEKKFGIMKKYYLDTMLNESGLLLLVLQFF